MHITKDKAVTIEFTLTDTEGHLIDSTQDGVPFVYLHGHSNFFESLENLLEGKSVGDTLVASFKPEEAYGLREDKLVEALPHSMFQSPEPPQVGQQFHAETEAGVRVVTVVHVDEEKVVIDANHPLAGVALNFDISITGIRDATKDEIAHGHIHAEGGCGHDHH